jgi:hypothetical protein
MNQADVDEVIRELARLSQTRYVFEDVGAQIGRVLAQRSAAGRYAGVADAASLAALVTEEPAGC